MNKEEIKKYLSDGVKRGKTLNHYKMLQMILKLVETDFMKLLLCIMLFFFCHF